FFDVAPMTAVLNDRNPELIFCYEIVRDHPAELFTTLKRMQVSENEFYRLRSAIPESLAPVERAARFIYLNKTCYNGLYRVNKKGQFNTPFGKYTKANFVDPENLILASRLLMSAKLVCGNYASVVDDMQEGDFVFFDPPYL